MHLRIGGQALLWSLAALLAQGSAPVHASVPVQASAPVQVQGLGLRFNYRRTHFSQCRQGTEPRLTVQENGTDYPDGIGPARVVFTLKSVRPPFIRNPKDWQDREATLCVLPMADATVPSYEKAYPFLSETAQDLMGILRSRRVQCPINRNLPDWNQGDCHQSIHAKAALVETPWCRGVQYITACLQEASEISNDQLYYHFEGISRDGSRYVSLGIPIAHPRLPLAAPGIESARAPELEAYFLRAEKLLDAAGDDTFFPSLGAISALVRSIAGPDTVP